MIVKEYYIPYIFYPNYQRVQYFMEKEPKHPTDVFSHFDTFNIICSFLTLKDKLTLGSASKLISYFLEEHFSFVLNQGTYDKVPDKTMRQLIKYNFNRNLRVVRIPSILSQGKEQSTHFNFFNLKCITKIQAGGKHFIAFVDNKNKAYVTKASEFFSIKFNPNIHYQIFKDVNKIFCKSQKLFVLNVDGTVSMANASQNKDVVFTNLQMIDWTLRVPVQDMSVSKNYAIFLLGCIKMSEIKKLILLEEAISENTEQKQTVKIIVYNIQINKFYIINYPYKQIKSYCIGSSIAYFVNQNHELIHCPLTNINEGQTELTASTYSNLQNKRVISIYAGLNFYIALTREETVLGDWNNDQVINWLRTEGFQDYINIMRIQKVDGKKLINMEKKYMENVLGITNANLQQKMLLSIEQNMKVSYKMDRLHGWGKNQTGQLGNSMAVFVNKPVNIKLPQLNKNQNIVDIICGWYNTILKTSENRIFITTQEVKKEEKKEKEEEISDQQLKEIEKQKKEKKRKKTQNQEEIGNSKKDRKKKGTIDQKQIQKKKQKYQEQSHWIQYKPAFSSFSINTTKDVLFLIQLSYKQEQTKKKIRTVKAILDKIAWDPNMHKQDYKIGYLDKYMGVLQVSIDQYLKSEIKEHRICYFKNNGQIVWHKEDKIDTI